MSVGATRYGISFSAGGEAQPDAAPATPMPTSFRKSRRSKTIFSLIALLVVAGDTVHGGRILRVIEMLPVTSHAPAHLERRVLVHLLHLLHRAVALRALDSLQHVALVIELHVRGKLVDPDPRH